MPVDQQILRAAMRQWSTGVTVVTTLHNGVLGGMTVSSFTSVSLEPPTVLVCLNKDTFAHHLVSQSGIYAISMLAQGQEALSQRFAGFDPTVTDRFEGISFNTAETGSPLLPGAVVWLDCVVVNSIQTGTHTIFIGEVIFAQTNPDRAPLVYHNRKYHTLVEVG